MNKFTYDLYHRLYTLHCSMPYTNRLDVDTLVEMMQEARRRAKITWERRLAQENKAKTEAEVG